jgi:DNA-binding CsgD family transcriptional regulator/tetratricopeptide (TPR) repeat protein
MSHVGSLQCPIIVGRDDLLDLADRRLAEAAAGHGQILLLAGEAGIGKTRLLHAIRQKARAAGYIMVNGSLAPQDRDLPCALILDLARTFRGAPGFGDLGDQLLGIRFDENTDALGSRRLFVLDVVDRIVAAITRPVLFNLEDLQWSDEISLEIIGELGRRIRELPALIVGAYRTEELPPGALLREWRARLIAQRLAEEARLSPLTYDQTALMTTLILGTGLPAPREVVTAVHERTDGIPLHIEELLGALGEDARSDGRKIRDAEVPNTIEDAILARITQLSPEAREVARAGAVIGRCFIPAVLAGVMDRPVADLDGPIAELIERSYLYDAGDVGFIDFRHQLLRDVLYRTVPATDLRRFHARAAEFGVALEGQSEIHASVHFERAGLRAEAFRTALAGALAASRMSSRREAFELFRRAIDNMPDDLPTLEQAELYVQYSNAAGAIERTDEADKAARLARELYLAADRPLEAAELLVENAVSSGRQGEPVERRLAWIAQAIDEVERLPETPEREQMRGMLLGVRAITELDASMLDAAVVDAAESLRLAEAASDDENALEATLTAARIDIASGRYETGLVQGLEAARAARDAGFESVGVTGYRNLAIFATRVLDYASARTALGEGLRYADAIEQSHCRQMMATTSAFLAWASGDWDMADATARQELVDRGCRRGVLGSLDVIGLVAMGRGQIDEARHWLDESLDAGRRTGEIPFIMPALWGLAELDLIAGDARGAVDRCEEALELATTMNERALLVPFIVTGVRAWLAAHRPEEAERWLTRVRDFLSGWDALTSMAVAHADGLLRLSAGSLSAARDALETAVRGWTERGRIWEASWARLDLAHCLMRSNRFAEAATSLAAARSTAQALGSDPLIARADELARVGRGRGTFEEPWRPLTSREFEVARLIAEGMTNGEIAAELSIAAKTASSHVEHILAKLGVTRRAEIAAWVATISRGQAPGFRREAATSASR